MTNEEAISWLRDTFKPMTKDSKQAREVLLNIITESKEDVRIRQLQNRCFVFSRGMMCIFCDMDCDYRTGEKRK